jgi:DNA-binding MarR family transcriptional regulator
MTTATPHRHRFTANAAPNPLAAALAYAQRGWHVFPVHNPIFNAAGHCTGCTCEYYRRSEPCRLNHPHLYLGAEGKCENPGKCPRVRWSEKSTTDPEIIQGWWGKARKDRTPEGRIIYNVANIGIDCGKSGLLTLDCDTYKKLCGDLGDLLTWEERQTVTAISGGGGEHLLFDRQGKPYGNATQGLPPGIDIRGVGGYIVAAPSLHKSGRRYQWEAEYAPDEAPLQPLPSSLDAILAQAHTSKGLRQTAAIAVSFGAVAQDAPDLSRWPLSAETLERIHTPAPKGQRSEADMSVCIALCAAGINDDEILAIFSHYPIGANGKFAELGHDYLARTLTNARAWLAEQERQRQQTAKTLENLRLWIRTHSFENFIPPELRSEHYRTDASDTKVADAWCDLFAQQGKLLATAGKRQLAKLAGVGCNTAFAATLRLNGWLYDVHFSDAGMTVVLKEEFRLQQIDHERVSSNVSISDPSTVNGLDQRLNEYSPRKNSDPFLTGRSRTIFDQAVAASLQNAQSVRELLAAIPSGLGETCLRVLDALTRCGDLTVAELVEETGKKVSALRSACQRLEQHELVESYRAAGESARVPKHYALTPGVWQRVEALAPQLKTYKLSVERENIRLRDSQRYLAERKAQAPAEEQPAIQRTLTWLANQRIKLLTAIYPERSQEEIARLAFDAGRPGPHPAILAKINRLHENAKIDLLAQRRAAQWRLTEMAQALDGQA